jgi:hypothetical protein
MRLGWEVFFSVLKVAGAVIAVPAFFMSLFWGRISMQRMRKRDYWWMRWFP